MTLPSVTGTPVTGGSTASNTVVSSSHTPSANDLLLAFVALRDRPSGVSVSSVSGNGLTWANVGSKEGTQGEERVECWRAQGASPSSGAVTATLSATCNAAVIVVVRVSGANTGGTNGSTACEVVATNDTGATDTNTPSVSITPLSNDSLVLAGFSHRTQSFTVGTGETSVSLNNLSGTAGDATRLSVESHGVTTPASTNMDGSLAGAIDWSGIAVAIKPAGNSIALSTTIASTSSTPDTARAQIARALSTTIASSSTTPSANLRLALALQLSIAATSSTPSTARLQLALALVLTIAATSSTPDTASITNILNLAATIAATSSTPDTVRAQIDRALSTAIAATSSTPDTARAQIARALELSVAAGSTTPDTVTLGLALALALSIAATSSTPDTVNLTNALALALAIVASSSTPDTVRAQIARALELSIAATSSTGDIDFAPLLAALSRHVARVPAYSRSIVALDDRVATLLDESRSYEV